MSVINKKPFIKKVLESLSENESAALLSLIDGGAGATLSRTPSTITENDAGVHRCYLSIKEGLFTGYLLLTDDYCVHIAYKDAQALDMIEIKDGKYKFVTEPLDIAELRSELDDLGTVESAEILDVIEGAQSGTIQDALGLDSNGGLVKGTISGGGGTTLYKHTIVATGMGGLEVTFDAISYKSTAFTDLSEMNEKAFSYSYVIYNDMPDMLLGFDLVGDSLNIIGVGNSLDMIPVNTLSSDTVTEL